MRLRIFRLGTRGNVDVDLEFLEFLVDEVEGSCDDWVRDLDSFKGEDAEFELVQGSWCGVFQGLDFEEEDRGCRVNAVCEGEDDVVVAEGTAVKVE